jgi:hypothetical protein
MAITMEKRLGQPGADGTNPRDVKGARGDKRSAAKAADTGAPGIDGMPGARIGGKKVDKSKTTINNNITDNSKTGDVTDKSRDRSRSVQTGDIAGAKTGDVSVPVSAVPGG